MFTSLDGEILKLNIGQQLPSIWSCCCQRNCPRTMRTPTVSREINHFNTSDCVFQMFGRTESVCEESSAKPFVAPEEAV